MKMKLRDKATLISTQIMVAAVSINPALAADGDMQDTLTKLSPVFQKAGPVLSLVLNAACIGLAIYSAVKAIMGFGSMMSCENPQEAEQKKKSAITNLIAAAIFTVAVILINIILNIMGINFSFAN